VVVVVCCLAKIVLFIISLLLLALVNSDGRCLGRESLCAFSVCAWFGGDGVLCIVKLPSLTITVFWLIETLVVEVLWVCCFGESVLFIVPIILKKF